MTSIARRIATIGQWTPRRLGGSLVAWWDAEVPSSLTLSGGSVSAWLDQVAGYSAVQAVGGSKPTFSSTSFNGRPGITFDGVDDYLELTPLPVAFPIGASPVEFWAVLDQLALPADTGDRVVASYGDTTTATGRRMSRTVSTGTNRGQVLIGSGGGSTGAMNTAVDLSGRHVMRGIVGASASQCDVDGAVGTPSAVVPAAGSVRLRIGSSNGGATGGSFMNGRISTLFFTSLLGAADAALTLAYCNRRR